MLLAGILAFFGVIHSPLAKAPIAMPGDVVQQLRQEGRYAATARQTPYHWAAAYGLSAVALWCLGRAGKPPRPSEDGLSERPES